MGLGELPHPEPTRWAGPGLRVIRWWLPSRHTLSTCLADSHEPLPLPSAWLLASAPGLGRAREVPRAPSAAVFGCGAQVAPATVFQRLDAMSVVGTV